MPTDDSAQMILPQHYPLWCHVTQTLDDGRVDTWTAPIIAWQYTPGLAPVPITDRGRMPVSDSHWQWEVRDWRSGQE